MGWKEDARRTIVSDKKMLKSFPEGWVKVKKFSVKGNDEINAALRKLQSVFDRKAIMSFAKKARDGADEKSMLQEMTPEEMGMILDGNTAESYDLIFAKIKNGVAMHNFCDGDIETRSTEKDIQGFAKDILEYPDIANEIVSLIEDYNRPLVEKRSETSKMSPNGSSEEQSSNQEMNSQTEEIRET